MLCRSSRNRERLFVCVMNCRRSKNVFVEDLSLEIIPTKTYKVKERYFVIPIILLQYLPTYSLLTTVHIICDTIPFSRYLSERYTVDKNFAPEALSAA